MKTWTVTVTATFEYTEDEHGEWIASAEDAIEDVRSYLGPLSDFEIEVEEGEA